MNDRVLWQCAWTLLAFAWLLSGVFVFWSDKQHRRVYTLLLAAACALSLLMAFTR